MSDLKDLMELCEATINKSDVKGTQKSQVKLLGSEAIVIAKQNKFIVLTTSEGSVSIPQAKFAAVLDELMKFSDQEQ